MRVIFLTLWPASQDLYYLFVFLWHITYYILSSLKCATTIKWRDGAGMANMKSIYDTKDSACVLMIPKNGEVMHVKNYESDESVGP